MEITTDTAGTIEAQHVAEKRAARLGKPAPPRPAVAEPVKPGLLPAAKGKVQQLYDSIPAFKSPSSSAANSDDERDDDAPAQREDDERKPRMHGVNRWLPRSTPTI